MSSTITNPTTGSKIISIAGRIDSQIINDEMKLSEARQACFQIGEVLARSEWKLAVYTSDSRFIETDIIKGYLSTGMAKEKSIICYYPQGVKMDFPQMKDTGKKFFDEKLDTSHDWEVSFYRSLTKIDAVLLLGGGTTTMTAGQIALSRGIAIISIAEYGGAANVIWKNLRSEGINLDDSDFQAMAKWDDNSPTECINSLNRQYEKMRKKVGNVETELQIIKSKADQWDAYTLENKKENSNFYVALTFLFLFIGLLIAGLISVPPDWAYPIITVLGLCSAGGVGATVRMVAPNPPGSQRKIVPLLGVTVGLLFSLLYLLPQLIKSSSLLVPSDKIDPSTRIQYVSSMVVAFLAGLGFDYSLEQLLRRSQQNGTEIANRNPDNNERNT